MNGSLQPSGSVPFWPEHLVADFDADVPIMYKSGRKLLRDDWPRGGPSEQVVLDQLLETRRAWFRVDVRRENHLYALTANYHFDAYISDNGKMWFGRVGFASNDDRRRMIESGVQIKHQGIRLLTQHQMGRRESTSRYLSSGQFTRDLHRLIVTSDKVLGGRQDEVAIGEAEAEVLETLQVFVDTEFELEERAAQQQPGFFYHNLVAVSRSGAYRQYYDLEIEPEDYSRMLEIRPSILAPSDDMGLPSDVRFEVTDLQPETNRPQIRVNVARQTEWFKVPQEGRLLLSVFPTLRTVRSNVLEALREDRAANHWLMPVLADVQSVHPYSRTSVRLPPSEYPPTASQRRAIDMGVGAPDYALILGPPGTGKTTVILSMVRHFVNSGMRVLVASQTNKAVDNVLERLAEDDDLECVRIGNETRVSSALETVLLDNKVRELQRNLFAQVNRSIEYLEQADQFLGGLEARLDQIVSAQRLWLAARGRLTEIERNIQEREITLKELTRKRDLTVRDVSEIEERISSLIDSRWPWILDLVGRRIRAIRLRLARGKLRSLQAELTRTDDVLSTELGMIEQLSGDLASASSSLVKVDDDYRSWFSGRPDDYVSEIQLPLADNLSEEGLAQIRQELDAIHRDIVQWDEKLSNERQQSLYPLLLEGVDVVGATCIGINTRALFRDMDFDVVIVDESGQIQAHNLIVPLSRAPKAILVGDHKQLPPVVQDEIREEISERGFHDGLDLYERSWFEHLWDRAPDDRKVMLKEQFRCPSVIADFVSKAFYEGEYLSGPGMDQKGPLFSFCPGPLVFMDTGRIPGRFESSTHDGTRSIINDNAVETRLVVELLCRALAEQPELAYRGEIGVIVPYRNHVTEIHRAIRDEQRRGRLLELNMPLQELVASIDSFQGQERDLIILPFTRSNARGDVGFLRDWRRLNVGLTRAKRQAIAIGDVSTLTSRPNPGNRAFKEAMRLLVRTCDSAGCLLDGSNFYPEATASRHPGSNVRH